MIEEVVEAGSSQLCMHVWVEAALRRAQRRIESMDQVILL